MWASLKKKKKKDPFSFMLMGMLQKSQTWRFTYLFVCLFVYVGEDVRALK